MNPRAREFDKIGKMFAPGNLNPTNCGAEFQSFHSRMALDDHDRGRAVAAHRRMIQNFENFIGFRKERLFDELDTQVFQSRDNFLIMLRRPRFICVDE